MRSSLIAAVFGQTQFARLHRPPTPEWPRTAILGQELPGLTSRNSYFESSSALPPNNPNAIRSTAPTVMAESATLKAGYDHACQ